MEKKMTPILFDITFENAKPTQEYGSDEKDVRQFIKRVFPEKIIKSITPVN